MIVITGAAGFIASNVARGLAQEGYRDLVLVDDFSVESKRMNWEDIPYAALVHRDHFFEWIEHNHQGIQYLFHLGAKTDTMEMNETLLDQMNFHYSQEVWKRCVQWGIPLLYASSAATYGDGALGFDVDYGRIKDLQPLNPYGWSKHKFDLWNLAEQKKPKQWVGLKFFNVYGPFEQHKGKMASVAYHAYHQIKESGTLKLFKSYHKEFEDGGQKRDFIYVQDIVKMCLIFLKNRNISGIFNAGSGSARTFTALGESLFQAMNLPQNIQYIDMPENLKNQYQYFTEARMDSFLQNFSLIFTPIESGILSYVQHLDKQHHQ